MPDLQHAASARRARADARRDRRLRHEPRAAPLVPELGDRVIPDPDPRPWWQFAIDAAGILCMAALMVILIASFVMG
jgi:hypothetical protein